MKKLSESIWSDMQDRSAGETVRKEDDISRLDNEGLYDYIKSKYESRIPNFNVDMGNYTNKSSNEKNLLIQPYGRWKPLMLYVFYNDGKIGEICTHFDKFKRWNFNILKQKYLLIPDRHYDECNYNFKISEKDGTITNHTVIGIIDILVEDKSKILLESIWSDMQDRSAGEIVRKEDDINLLDTDEFIEYLKKSYKVCIHDRIIGFYTEDHKCKISIPIEMNDYNETPNMGNRILSIIIDLEPGGEILIMPNMYVFRLYPREIQKTFGDKYIINTSTRTLTPKDKIVNNSVIVDVIDKLLGMVENPILKKN